MAGKKPKERNRTKSNLGRVKAYALSFFVAGAFLRILLCWSNSPSNAFDNHYEPILMMMETGSIPAKDACWQCYHPPVFYGLSAMAGKLFMSSGVQLPQIVKLLQFANCLYGILTLVFVYLILKKLPLPDIPKTLAFGLACFLPRHIYMSAMNSNDTISYLFVAMSLYLLLITIERRFPIPLVMATSIVISITLFTKYTAYAVLPAVLAPFVFLYFKGIVVSRKKIIVSFVLMLFLPVALLSGYFVSNYRHYGAPLPWNVQKLDPSLTQPRDYEELSFISFKPWDGIASPMLVPGRMHSFWTLLYNGMWFDNEPRFLYYMDSNHEWWNRYFDWRRGSTEFPGDNNSIAFLTTLTGSCLVGFGLIPLFLLIKGGYHYGKNICNHWREGEGMETAKMSIFPALLIANAAIIIAMALRLQVYSAIKASYFLNSLPTLAIGVSYGLASYDKTKALKKIFVFGIGLVFVFAGLHILHLCWALHYQ